MQNKDSAKMRKTQVLLVRDVAPSQYLEIFKALRRERSAAR